MERVSIIIPAHNEEKRIGKALGHYSDYFNSLRKKEIIDYEIIVVVNATTDHTEDIVNLFSRKDPRIKLIDLEKGGKGYAVREGFKQALKGSSALIGFVDADLASPPGAFYQLIRDIEKNPGIIASRRHPESVLNPKQTFVRRITSRGFNFFARSLLFLNYKDTQCGCKLFRREPLEEIIGRLGMSQWAFDIEILYLMKAIGMPVKETRTFWSSMGDSKLNVIRTTLQMFFSVLQMRINYSPFYRIIYPTKPLVNSIWRAIR